MCFQYPCWSLNIWPNQAIVLHIILEELRTGGSSDMWVSHSLQLEILLSISAYLSEVISLDGVLPHSCLVPVIRCLELSTEASYWGRWAIRRTVMCLRHTTRWCLLPSTSLLQRYSTRSTRLPGTTACPYRLKSTTWGKLSPELLPSGHQWDLPQGLDVGHRLLPLRLLDLELPGQLLPRLQEVHPHLPQVPDHHRPDGAQAHNLSVRHHHADLHRGDRPRSARPLHLLLWTEELLATTARGWELILLLSKFSTNINDRSLYTFIWINIQNFLQTVNCSSLSCR